MFKSIKINNLRAITDLEIKNLGQVNLIVGQNNCGKTTILEAIFFLMDNYGYKEIGSRMGVATGTVSNIASKVLKKLDVSDRVTMILKHYDLPNWTSEKEGAE